MVENDETDHGEKVLCEWCLVKEAVGKFFVPGKGVYYLCEQCKMLVMSFIIDAG
jgi:hypothetical protein